MAVVDDRLPRVLSATFGQHDVKITPYVIFTCIMAGSGGLMYGYDLVIAGGISLMDDFLRKFYPTVYMKKQNARENNYCKYNNEVFQLFTSSLYLAAVPATFVASVVSRKFGRRETMLVAGIFFISGTILGTSAQNLNMLIAGRIFLGCGIGFANHAVPIYLSEIAPPSMRGGLSLFFTVFTTVGVFSGSVVNYIASNIRPWGWRLSLGVAGLPALMVTLFSLLVVETPGSLLERGRFDEAKAVLRKIRGIENIEAEYEDLLKASRSVEELKNPFRELLARRRRPQLVLACAFPFFQQVVGNDAILFYGVFLFKTAGFGDQAALYSAILVGASSLFAECVAIFVVDRVGRRRLLFLGTIFMCAPLKETPSPIVLTEGKSIYRLSKNSCVISFHYSDSSKILFGSAKIPPPRRILLQHSALQQLLSRYFDRRKPVLSSTCNNSFSFSNSGCLPHYEKPSSKVVMAGVFAAKVKANVEKVPLAFGAVDVAMICMFKMAFNLSLGPLAWLIPSEIWGQDVRSAGQSVTVCVNMLFKFAIAQTFLSMLCAFRWGMFLFFAVWPIFMGVFTVFFVPETKKVPLHKMSSVWQKHWFWRSFVPSFPVQDAHPHEVLGTTPEPFPEHRSGTP